MSNPRDSYRSHYRFDWDTAPHEIRKLAEPLYFASFVMCGCGERDCCECRSVREALDKLCLLRVRPPMRLL